MDEEAFENMQEKGLKTEIENIIIEKEKDIQKQMVENKIREARYNKKYKKLGREIGKPSYLRKKAQKRQKQMIESDH